MITCSCGEEHGPLLGGTIRWVPGHRWVRMHIGRVRHPGHKWMYSGIVRRDTFTALGWGLIVMRMPARPAAVRAARGMGATTTEEGESRG